MRVSAEGCSTFESAAEGDLVGVFEVSADREPGGQAGDSDAQGGLTPLAQVLPSVIPRPAVLASPEDF